MQQIYRKTPLPKCDFHLDARATSKIWTPKNLDPEKHAPKNTWSLKNMNPGKYGVNMGGIKKNVCL